MRAGPEFATVRAKIDNTVERFHHGVSEVRNVVFSGDGFRGASKGLRGIANFLGDVSGSCGEFGELFRHFGGGERRVFSVIPVDFQFVAANLCGPEAIGDDDDTGRNLFDGANTGNFERIGRIDTGDLATKCWRARDNGIEHAGDFYVETKLSAAVRFGRCV